MERFYYTRKRTGKDSEWHRIKIKDRIRVEETKPHNRLN